MFKFIKNFSVPIILLCVFMWLNDGSPAVVIEAFERRITTTVTVLCAILLLLAYCLYVVIYSLRSIFVLPLAIVQRNKKKIEQGKFRALADFCISFERGSAIEVKRALSYLKKADMPVYVKDWLSYRECIINGVDDGSALQSMMQYKETAVFATIKLIQKQIDLAQYDKALNNIQNFTEMLPAGWCVRVSAFIHYKLGKYQECIALLDNAVDDLRNDDALHVYAMSLVLSGNQNEQAIKFVRKNWSENAAALFKPALELITSAKTKCAKLSREIVSGNTDDLSLAILLCGSIADGEEEYIENILSEQDMNVVYADLFRLYYKDAMRNKHLFKLLMKVLTKDKRVIDI